MVAKPVWWLLGLVLLASSAHADDSMRGETTASSGRQSYSLGVFKVAVAPTKSDGRVWDGAAVIKDLPQRLGPAALMAAVGKKLLQAGLDATAAPDIYVVVEVNGKKLQTSVQQDTDVATWAATEQQLTVAARAGDYLQIEVFDRDLQENTWYLQVEVAGTGSRSALAATIENLRSGLKS